MNVFDRYRLDIDRKCDARLTTKQKDLLSSPHRLWEVTLVEIALRSTKLKKASHMSSW